MLGVVGALLQPLVDAADRKHADEKTGDVDGETATVFKDDAALDGGAVAEHPKVAHRAQHHGDGDDEHVPVACEG